MYFLGFINEGILLLLAVFTAGYTFIVLFIAQKWRKTPVFVAEIAKTVDLPSVSVLIAARNEAQKIEGLLAALAAQNFPPARLEIIVINDHSDDDTAACVERFAFAQAKKLDIRCLNLENGAGKKAAIAFGLAQSCHELIVTTDADCLPVSTEWLAEIAGFYAKTGAKMIAAPVVFHNEKNTLGYFQTADFVAMMAVTAVGIQTKTILMCNGANLAYPRTAFAAVGGFEGNMHRASGDDMFLMHKIAAQFPNSVHFLHSPRAIVCTEPQHSWQAFMQQRLRWGAKNTAYSDWRITAVLGLVWLYCVSFFIFTIFFCYFDVSKIGFLVLSLGLKMLLDAYLLYRVAPFFGRHDLLRAKHFLPSFFLYLYYMLSVGTRSLLQKKYNWKGRSVR